jgi:hypothetical protein
VEEVVKTYIAKNGMKIIMCAYKGNKDVDVKFEDGKIVKNQTLKDFQEGNIDYPA